MKLPNDTFCVLPWVSLEASPIGSVRPCCLADEGIEDDDGLACNLIDDTLEEIQTTKYMRKLRRKFLKGEKPKTCRKCWDVEKADGTSKRMHTINRLKHIVKDEEWTEDAKELQFLDLKLGNICNLSCRICGSWSSSTFAAEEIKAIKPPNDPKNSFHYQMLRQGRWPRNNERFWQNLWDISNGIRYLEFTGGEPFMIQEHFDYLDWLATNGLAGEIEIHYNTNGTQWPSEENRKIWKWFKHVEIAFSIDNVGVRFEYERTGADWPTVNHNVAKFIKLREEYQNISLQLCCTVNLYNVYYLESVAYWTFFNQFDFVYWNLLHDAPEDSIQSLPSKAKKAVAKKLKGAKVSEPLQKEFKQIIQFMQQPGRVKPADVRRKIKMLDERRNMSLRSTHPALYKLIFNDTT